MKVKVGIFFGGPSQEQALSFAGGRTVYDNLNKAIFEAVPIFVDDHKNFILLNWPLLYNEEISDFYNSPENWEQLSAEQQTAHIVKVGKRLAPLELPKLIDIAFLTLTGTFGGSGQLQEQLTELQIPFTGSGARVCETANTPAQLQPLLEELGLAAPDENGQGSQPFSCLLIRQDDGAVVAVPKIQNSELSNLQIGAIRKACERLFSNIGLQAFAQIDGTIDRVNTISLLGIRTTPDFSTNASVYQRAAEIGLNPTQFLTFALRTSLQERIKEQPDIAAYKTTLNTLDEQIDASKSTKEKIKIAVIIGGDAATNNQSLDSGRTVFGSLASSEKYDPVPVYLQTNGKDFQLHQLPIDLLLAKDRPTLENRLSESGENEQLAQIKANCQPVLQRYGSQTLLSSPQRITFGTLAQKVDAAFIAVHGRPGEDGQLQKQLEAHQIPYTGSDVLSAEITIDKYKTLQILDRNGFEVPYQLLAKKARFAADKEAFYENIELEFTYPFVAKPVDSGSGLAVQVIQSREELESFVQKVFQTPDSSRKNLPEQEALLIESLITPKEAKQFLEITGYVLTHHPEEGDVLIYEIFEPSEYQAATNKYRTPAEFSPEKKVHETIAQKVKKQLENAARVLNLQGYAQVDAFVRISERNQVETVIFEINALPTVTASSPILQQAALNGYQPLDLLDHIISFARKKHQPAATVAEAASVVVDEAAEATERSEEVETEKGEGGEKGESERPVVVKEEETIINEATAETEEDAYVGSEPPKTPTFWDNIKAILLRIWRPVWAFLKSGPFLKNFGALVGILLLLFVLFRGWLKMYTHHDESLTVHDYVGMPLEEAQKKAKEQSFDLTVIDSTFGPDHLLYEIYAQDPGPMSRVKENRTIYVSVYHHSARDVTLPSLVGNYDFEQYKKKLKRKRIDAVIKERVFDAIQEENTIQHFFYNGQKITQNDIKKGFKVPEGSVLEFVVTERQTGFVPLPNLVCKPYKAAAFLISSNNLNIGNVIGDVPEDNAYVWKQEPAYEAGQMIQVGRQIDIYITDIRPGGCPEEE